LSCRLLHPAAVTSPFSNDVTSVAVVPTRARSRAAWWPGKMVVCGWPIVARLYEVLARPAASDRVDCFPLVAEGRRSPKGPRSVSVDGPARTVLAGERAALDFVMVLSGIATEPDAGSSGWRRARRRRHPQDAPRSARSLEVRRPSGWCCQPSIGPLRHGADQDNHIGHAGSVAAAVRSAAQANPGSSSRVRRTRSRRPWMRACGRGPRDAGQHGRYGHCRRGGGGA